MFEEMCPFFINKPVPIEAVAQEMLDYLKRTGRIRGQGKKLVRALSVQKNVNLRPAFALVCRTRGGNHSCLLHH